jgi:hypothetical protein
MALQESKETGQMFFDNAEAAEVFSVFILRYACSSHSSGYCEFKTMIEPLAFFLRHPAALCKTLFSEDLFPGDSSRDGLMNQDYIFFATKKQAAFAATTTQLERARINALHAGTERAGHTYMDLGALVRAQQVLPHIPERQLLLH